MPPKAYAAVVEPLSPSPPPLTAQSIDDAQDILVVSDIMDTLDQIPSELTRVHSDLNELGAVLFSTLVNLETKLNTLINWIQDPTIGPERRFQLLQEIAEEAARYKLGGDDKIRVAGGACDGIMAHQRHISNLLASSTLLQQGPPSPYTQSLTLSYPPMHTSSRRGLARQVNSPFAGPANRSNAAAGASGTAAGTGDTPTKKKKSRMQVIGRDDDEVSSVGGEKKKAPVKKRKPVNRATSPADSLASASAFNGKPSQPQTARQLAAALSKAKKAERADDSDEDSDDDRRDGLGLDVGSREGSHIPGRSANGTPNLPAPKAGKAAPADKTAPSSSKRSRFDEDDGEEYSDMMDEDDGKPAPKRSASNVKSSGAADRGVFGPGAADMERVSSMENMEVMEGEMDTKVYCTCRNVSYGEMIGCDDDDCEIEWYHLSCLGLSKTPEGNWICPRCVERRKKNPKKKPKVKSRK